MDRKTKATGKTGSTEPDVTPETQPDTKPENRYVAIAQIRVDGGTQMRGGIAQDTLEDYAAIVKEDIERAEAACPIDGKLFDHFRPTLPPVKVNYDGEDYWLWDGFHRRGAYMAANAPVMPCIVYAGTRHDAIKLAAGANSDHGMRRTASDKRRAVQALFELAQELGAKDKYWNTVSNNEIAKIANVSLGLVNQMASEQGRESGALRNPHKNSPKAIALAKSTQGNKSGKGKSDLTFVKSDDPDGDDFDSSDASRSEQDASTEDDLTDEDWMNEIPAYRVLKPLKHKGMKFRDDALSYRTLAQNNVLSQFNYYAHRYANLKDGGSTSYTRDLANVVFLTHPNEWKLCSNCGGNGCDSCGYAGYNTRNGIDATQGE